MQHEWTVTVKDDTGAPVTGATVALVQTTALAAAEWPFPAVAATHTHAGQGRYTAAAPIQPVAGEWTLIVRAAGRSPVVQPLKLADQGTLGFKTTPTPKTAATVTFVATTKLVGATGTRHADFTVTLYPSSEFVLFSGIEYESMGTRFHLFAERRRDDLVKAKRCDAGAIMTLFVPDLRARRTTVRAAGGGWLTVADKSFGDASVITPGQDHRPVVGQDISIVDVYKYLSAVGGAEPGRVKEVSIFSHAYWGGPILFNTYDTGAGGKRSAGDFDGRIKDFNAVNAAGWPKLRAAMAADGRWMLWGCSATTHFQRLMHGANKLDKKSEAFFTVDTAVRSHGKVVQTIRERTTRPRVRALLDAEFRGETYLAAAAKFLDLPVYGAPPGTGASFSSDPGMFIDTATYAYLYNFLKQEFAPEFVAGERGYVDYNPLRKRAAATSPAFSSQFFKLTQDLEDVETTLEFESGPAIVKPVVGFTISSTAQTKFFGMSGWLYEVKHKDAAQSFAEFVADDGARYPVLPDAQGKFTLLGPKR